MPLQTTTLISDIKSMTAFRWLAILLGLSIPGFYLGQATGILIVLICFALLLSAPTLRCHIADTLRQLWQKPESKWLFAFLICLVPSIFVSVVPLTSVRTWGLGIIIIMIVTCLCVFIKASLSDKLLAIKIIIIGLLLWQIFTLYGYYYQRSWLIDVWSIRTKLGIVDKIWSYYVFSIPKFLLNGNFVLLPLIIYCGVVHLKNNYWRFLIFLTTISFMWLALTLNNRAVLAGSIAVLFIANIVFWVSSKTLHWIKFAVSGLLIFVITTFIIFHFLPRGGFDSQPIEVVDELVLSSSSSSSLLLLLHPP